MKTIGVLSYQGSVTEHLNALKKIKGIAAKPVKYQDELRAVDGLILPGGESTTISKLLRDFGLFSLLKQRIETGMPVWGTCAGLILLAREVAGQPPHLAVMDIAAVRNAYGTQLDSFNKNVMIPKISPKPIAAVFIRAPWVEKAGEGVEVLLKLDGKIAAARQKNMLVTSFHPELSNNLKCHEYFVRELCENN